MIFVILGAGLLLGIVALFAVKAQAGGSPVHDSIVPVAQNTVTDAGVVMTAPNPFIPQSDGVTKLGIAIATAEGFFFPDPAVIPRRAHNPGDLTKSFGFPTDGVANAEGVLIFNSDNDGFGALYAQLNLIRSGGSHVYSLDDTISSMAEKWVGNRAAAAGWAKNVAEYLNISTDMTLAQVLA